MTSLWSTTAVPNPRFKVLRDSTDWFAGIPLKTMMEELKGEIVYNQETDRHFPHLTVGQTTRFAPTARTPQTRYNEVPRET